MAITGQEQNESREWLDHFDVILRYTIFGSADDVAVRAWLLLNSPTLYNGLPRTNINVIPLVVDEDADTGEWMGEVRYRLASSVTADVGDSLFNFEVGGQQEHITQSIQTIGKYPSNAPDFKGAINVTDQGVQGVTIPGPGVPMSETHWLSASSVNAAYIFGLQLLYLTSNQQAFRGYNANQVLFLGASGTRRGIGSDWEITYRFAVSFNRSNFNIGDIVVTSKQGWELLWVLYADQEDPTAKSLVKRPIAAYVEKVHELANFAAIGIGTNPL